MTLKINLCSNPDCHGPYQEYGYAEAIVMIELGDRSFEYRVFSLCQSCKKSLNRIMVANIIYDVIQYETAEKHSLTNVTRHELESWDKKYSDYKIIEWANNRIELDDKLAIA